MMNNDRNDDKLVGTFELQTQVFKKIEELKQQGYNESDMYIVSKDGANVDSLQSQTSVNITSGDSEGTWKDKFKNLFTSDETEKSLYRNINDDESYDNDYGSHVDNGRILLYVDRDFASTGGTFAPGTAAGTEESLKLHEERLSVDKERVQTGEVHVSKHVVEEEQTIDVPVEREEVYVERRPVNDETVTGDAFNEKDAIHVDLTEERVRVSKEDVVSEEVVVGKRKVQDTEHVRETVRREEADIDEGTAGNNGLFDDKNRKDGF